MNRTKGCLAITAIMLLLFSFIAVNRTVVIGDQPTPIISIIAPSANIFVDGNLDDWNTIENYTVTLYNCTEPSGAPPIEITFAFSYNSTHLFGFAIIPNNYGTAEGFDWHFFGKPRQDDGVHVDALNWYIYDLVFSDSANPGPPQPDENLGGTMDCWAASVITENQTIFEFEKKLNSGDTLGKDIALDYGNAIAVEFVSWMNINPSSTEPNYCMTLPGKEIEYVRLAIGDDYGDELQFGPYAKPPLYWQGSYSLNFIKVENNPIINYDGDLSDNVWNRAVQQTVDLEYYEWDTGFWDQNNFISADIYLIYDDFNIYFAASIYNPNTSLAPDECMFGVAIGKTESFYDDPDGFDFIMVWGNGTYEDTMLPGNHTMPISDVKLGGGINILAGGQLLGDRLQIEFSKPLAPNDPNGRDFDFVEGDTIFFGFVANFGHNSPNYVSIIPVPVNGYDEPAVAVYPAPLVSIGKPTTELGVNIDAIYSDASDFQLDGFANEQMFQSISPIYINLWYTDFNSAFVDHNNYIQITIKATHDGNDLYIWMELNRALDGTDDFLGLWMCPTDQPFDDPNPVDVAIFNQHGYYDMITNFYEEIPIKNDTDAGGTIDGNGIFALDTLSNITRIEFTKPLNSGDSLGGDISAMTGSSIYLMFLIACHSAYGEPNYYEVDIPPTEPVKFYVHQMYFKHQGEETSTSTETTGTETTGTTPTSTTPQENTFTIGFTVYDSLIILTIAITTVPILKKIQKGKIVI